MITQTQCVPEEPIYRAFNIEHIIICQASPINRHRLGEGNIRPCQGFRSASAEEDSHNWQILCRCDDGNRKVQENKKVKTNKR